MRVAFLVYFFKIHVFAFINRLINDINSQRTSNFFLFSLIKVVNCKANEVNY